MLHTPPSPIVVPVGKYFVSTNNILSFSFAFASICPEKLIFILWRGVGQWQYVRRILAQLKVRGKPLTIVSCKRQTEFIYALPTFVEEVTR